MKTRSTPLALIAAALLAGCAAIPRPESGEPARPPALRAWIGLPVGTSQVYPIFVNQEAYVALFEIVPGRGVSMVYPTSGEHAFLTNMHYADLALQLGRGFYFSDPFGFARFQPRYYYAVASVAPLNLTRLQASLGATRRLLGRMYASYRPYDVIDRLTELVVPVQPDEEWATDLVVDWPAPPPIWNLASFQRVWCANGRVILVDPNYPYHGCPGDAPVAVVASSTTTIDEVPRDSVRPVPVDSLRRRGGDRDRPIELSAPEAERRRRAEPGAPWPRAVGGTTRPPVERGAIRHSGDRPSPESRRQGQPARATASEPASDNSGRARPAEPREPRQTQPAPERSSGTERKPQ